MLHSQTASVAIPVAWPLDVPSRARAVSLMFDVPHLPERLQTPTLALLSKLTELKLATPPSGVNVEQWLLALATTWRLKAAAALATFAKSHSEAALQSLFEEAAMVRDALLMLATSSVGEPADKARALRELLKDTWGEVLEAAPARTGATNSYRAHVPARTSSKALPRVPSRRSLPQVARPTPPRVLRRALLAAAIVVLLPLAILSNSSEAPMVPSESGAPSGWIVSGDFRVRPATLMPATRRPTHHAQLKTWLERLEAEGTVVKPHGANEWLLIPPSHSAATGEVLW